ncbi:MULTISPECIES: SfnB family sulfur acquisition oxidoreductase [unclassified Aeromicrobium]|uniref:SfnB family sulfur acquisition oxidoreductase n=1 Tax=unclassified Aeromicrobium TaxID=2633570 RepID=UPI00396B0017
MSASVSTAERLTSHEHAVEVAGRLADEFAPGAARRDRDRVVPREELERIGQSGLLALTVPTELGGAGLGAATVAEVTRLLAVADGSISQVLQNHYVFVRAFLMHGDASQRHRLAARVVDGARLGNALSERGGPRTGVLTTRLAATDDPGRWRLSGRKYYATGALTAQIVPVRARGLDGGDVFVYVDRDAPGVEVIDDWASLGQRGTHSGTVVLTDVEVTPDDVIAPPAPVERPTADGAFGQLIHVAIDVGLAEGALAAAVDIVRTSARVYADSTAERASEDLHVLSEVGELEILVRGALALLGEAARRVDEAGEQPTSAQAAEASVAVAAAKVAASRTAVRVANELFALGGTSSTDESLGLDRWWRDARVHTLHDPDRYKLHHIGNWVLNGVRPAGALL